MWQYGVLVEFSLRYPPVMGRLHTRYAPVRRSPAVYCYTPLPLDLHVLSLPLAFILSQDQTLHCKISIYISRFDDLQFDNYIFDKKQNTVCLFTDGLTKISLTGSVRNDGFFLYLLYFLVLLVSLVSISKNAVSCLAKLPERSERKLEPRRSQGYLSRLRVQRYGDFSELPNVFATFLSQNRKKI